MSEEEQAFLRYVESLRLDDQPNPAHRDELESRLLARLRQRALAGSPAGPSRRVPIMISNTLRKPFIRYSTAAALLLAAAAVVFFMKSPGKSNTAWAAEQADQAMQAVTGVHITGSIAPGFFPADKWKKMGLAPYDETTEIRLWARKASRGNSSGDLRLETGDGTIIVVADGNSQIYDPRSHTVVLVDGQVATISPWLSSVFKALQLSADKWEVSYGADPQTGRDSAFVECSFGRVHIPSSLTSTRSCPCGSSSGTIPTTTGGFSRSRRRSINLRIKCGLRR